MQVMGEHPSDPLTHALLSALDVEVYVIDVSAYPTSRLTAIRFLAYEEYLIANRDRLAKVRRC